LSESEWRLLNDELTQGNFEPTIKQYEKHERDRRREIYNNSQKANAEKHRNYGSIEFEEIDRVARYLLTLGREDLEIKLNQLGDEEFVKVHERLKDLVNEIEKRINDRRALLREVANQKWKGRIPHNWNANFLLVAFKLENPTSKLSLNSYL
jgi:hypothetical protein